MKIKFAAALLVCSLSIGVARAQMGSPVLSKIPVSETIAAGPPLLPDCDYGGRGGDCVADRFWFRADYLLWWVKKGPLAAPLVTFGSDADAPFQGILGQPGTRLAFGGAGLDF